MAAAGGSAPDTTAAAGGSALGMAIVSRSTISLFAMRFRLSYALVAVLVSASGCFPSACNRTETRAIAPADSVSRALAAVTPVDTLEVLNGVRGTFEHPRTVAFGPGGVLWFTDTGRNSVSRVDSTGELTEVIPEDFEFPYLAGFRGGLPVAYAAGPRRLVGLDAGGAEAWSQAMPKDGPEKGALSYALATDSVTWFKVLGEEFGGLIVALDSAGAETSRAPLPGAWWRWAGFLRDWNGAAWSLSGYRPVLHRLDAGSPATAAAPDAAVGADAPAASAAYPGGAVADSLALQGFDSPMLARLRSFERGDADAPPLLTASAAGVDSLLFVLNMRPGWLNVDVYGPDARLRRVLTEPNPGFDKNFFPTDIAARRHADGSYEIAVTVTEPEAGVRRYRWAGF